RGRPGGRRRARAPRTCNARLPIDAPSLLLVTGAASLPGGYMRTGGGVRPRALRVLVVVLVPALPLVGAALASARAIMDDTTECLSQFQGVPAGDENGG